MSRRYMERGCIVNTHSRWGWVVSVMPQPHFSPGERTPSTHWAGGWVDPRASLEREATGKILSPLLGIEPWSPGRLAHSQTLYWLSYLAHINLVVLCLNLWTRLFSCCYLILSFRMANLWKYKPLWLGSHYACVQRTSVKSVLSPTN
jgi:hypothetical protein